MDSSIFHALFDWFNTREIATGIWLLAALVGFLLWSHMRPGLVQVFRAMVQWKLLVMFGSLALHVVVLCWLLSLVGVWSVDQFGSTALWFFMSGAVFLGRSLSAKEDDKYFKKLFKDSVTIGAVFEFVAVSHTFDLLTELLLVPVLTVLGALLAVAQMKDEYRPARIFFETIMVGVGVALLWHSVSGIIADPAEFFSTKTGRNFLLPIFLTIGSIPFIYIWHCASILEIAFIRINLKQIHSESLKRRAKWSFFWQFFLEPSLLQRAVRQFNSTPVSDSSGVRSIVREIRTYEKNAKRPPAVDARAGWSPYLARDFLEPFGLRTTDYHAIFDGTEWMASSPYVNLEDNIISNTAAFYLEGRPGIVTKLRLNGNFRRKSDIDEALNKFTEIVVALTASALGVSKKEAAEVLPREAPFEIEKGVTRLSSTVEEYPNEQGFRWNLVISRGLGED